MSWFSKAAKKFERAVSAIVPHEHAAQARERQMQIQEMADQKKAYEEQSKQLRDQQAVTQYDKNESAKRATSAFRRLRSGGSGLSSAETSTSTTLG